QMQILNKHKKKFDEIHDMRYVPKIRPNAMTGKPLMERLVPGVLFQILKENDNMSWFIAPELLYKISATFSVGAAGMYRVHYSLAPKMIWEDPVYGFKLIGQAKVYKGFYLRTEWENTSMVSSTSTYNSDPILRQWNSNWLAGIGRAQKISGRLNGYFWGFYNITSDPHDIFKNKVILKTGLQFNIVDEHKKIRKHITEKIEKQSAIVN
ncbi:MAG TPA: hypothetical protein VFE57_08660, partial [Cyclobacteriaceae bacterium]|nr:hypothetical protein [Cyclobacteriaceae bacterium]